LRDPFVVFLPFKIRTTLHRRLALAWEISPVQKTSEMVQPENGRNFVSDKEVEKRGASVKRCPSQDALISFPVIPTQPDLVKTTDLVSNL